MTTADRLKDAVSVIDYGLRTQYDIAELNKTVSEIINKREYSGVLKAFDELLKEAGSDAVGELADRQQRIEEISEELTRSRIDIMKEARLLQQLRFTNDVYAVRISDEIKEAQRYCDEEKPAQEELIRKRIYQLTTSKVVAENFSAQIKFSEDNCFDMAEKIWNALVTIVPLLRSSISMETGENVLIQTKLLISESMKEIEAKL